MKAYVYKQNYVYTIEELRALRSKGVTLDEDHERRLASVERMSNQRVFNKLIADGKVFEVNGEVMSRPEVW